MIPIPILKLAQICSGTLSADSDKSVTSVVRDNREVSNGSLFVAIKGERFDGHDFIASAFDAGAVCALAAHVPDGVGGPVIVVDDVMTALGEMAAYYRGMLKIPVVGVSGSVGKTTTKEMIASVLSSKFNVLKTSGNYNNELGVPLTLFSVEDYHEVAVVEMGISHFGEMEALSNIVRPDFGVLTLIGHAHLEALNDRAGVFRAKTEMLKGMSTDRCLILNGDDDMLVTLACPQKKVFFGLDKNNSVRGENIIYHEGLVSFDIVCGTRRLEAKIHGYGEHLVSAALAAAAIGFELGLTDNEIIDGLLSFEPVGRRARRVKTKTITLIDDCYNANPSSCACSLRSLRALEGRQVAILGDMLELGEASDIYHFELGSLAQSLGVEMVLCCGELAMSIADGAGDVALRFDNKQSLISALPGLIRPGDVVLVKASHSMHFEEISAAIEKL